MKTVVITKTKDDIEYWESMLDHANLNKIILYDTDLRILDNFVENDDEYFAVIIDRVDFDFKLLFDYLKNVDFFVIVNDWKDTLNYSFKAKTFSCRFYKMPIVKSVFIGEIQSITQMKEFTSYGEIRLGEITININARTIGNNVKSVFLCNKEFDLLLFLARNKGKVFSRSNLLDQVWDMNAKVVTNTVDVHVSKLRKILKSEFGISSLIKTIPCCGYVLTEVYGE